MNEANYFELHNLNQRRALLFTSAIEDTLKTEAKYQSPIALNSRKLTTDGFPYWRYKVQTTTHKLSSLVHKI